MPCQLAWLSNSALTIARLPCCSRFLLLKSMGRSRKGRNPAHAGGLHISPHKVQEGTLDLLLLHTPSRRECTSTCAYGHPNACAGAGWTKGRACSEVIGTVAEELLGGPPWFGVSRVLAAGREEAGGKRQPPAQCRASLRLPQPFFFPFFFIHRLLSQLFLLVHE